MVLNHLPGDPGHLRRFPGEHVDICPEDGDERAFLFLSQIPPDAGGLGGSAPTWKVFIGTSSVSDGRTLGALAGALAHEGEGSDPSVSACSFSTAATAAVRSPFMVRTLAGDGILRTRYP
jgi:hypothetical protein